MSEIVSRLEQAVFRDTNRHVSCEVHFASDTMFYSYVQVHFSSQSLVYPDTLVEEAWLIATLPTEGLRDPPRSLGFQGSNFHP